VAKQRKIVPAGIDIEADARQTAKPEELQAIINLAKRMYRLQLDIAKWQEEINKKVEELNKLELETLPQRMIAAGLKEFKLSNDYVVSVEDFIRASIPSQTSIDEAEGLDKQLLVKRREDCLKWLRKNGGESLLKTTLRAEFGKGEEKAALEFEKKITKSGFPVKRDSNIHYQTLNAFVREKLKEGVEVPVEPFSLFNGAKAKIKKVKEG
jgi:hypothetical protein